jgi:hypothetical protein
LSKSKRRRGGVGETENLRNLLQRGKAIRVYS